MKVYLFNPISPQILGVLSISNRNAQGDKDETL